MPTTSESSSANAPPHLRAVLHAQPLVNAKRQCGGTRLIIDNRSVSEEDLRETLALVAEANAGATAPMIVALADERLPDSLLDWNPPANTLPEFRGAWLQVSAARDMLAGRDAATWCLNGSPDRALEAALIRTLAYTVGSGAPDPAAACPPIPRKASVRTGARTQADADALFASGTAWLAGWPMPAAATPGKGSRTGNRAIVLRLLQLAQSDADIDELESVLQQDVGLAFKLLRFINSAANGLSIQVESFQHALMILGYRRLTRWLSLLVLASGEDKNQLPLMRIALLRGFFMERIGKLLVDDISTDELFITGLFSLLDRMFGQSFEELLEQVNLPEAVYDALRFQGEPYGALLRLAQAIEGEDATAIRDLTQTLGLGESDVNRALLLAIRDTERVDLG